MKSWLIMHAPWLNGKVVEQFGLTVLICSLALHSMRSAAEIQEAQKLNLEVGTAPGLRYTITKSGTGPIARKGQVIVFQYVAKLDDGTVFDDSRKRHEPAAIYVGEPDGWIKGLQDGVELLNAGDSAVFEIPPDMAYGKKGNDHLKVPPNATVHYEIDVVAIKSRKLSDVISNTISEHGIKAARDQFQFLKARNFPDVYAGSGQLNYLGYGYLYRYDKFPEAIALLQWNVGLYPWSGPLEDSLAEAYFVNGDRENAILHYERALKLQPDLKSSAMMLDKLKQNPKSPTDVQRLEMCLKNATAFGGPLAEQPMNILYLEKLLERYVASLSPAEAQDADKEVQLFFDVLSLDESQAQEAVYNQLGNSPAALVRQAVARVREADRETEQAHRKILDRLNKPIDMRFTALDGREVDLAKLRGSVILIEFWTAWSPGAAKALPDIIAAYAKYHAQGFEVVGVSLDQNPDTATVQDRALKRTRTADEVLAFTRENSMSWPQYYDGKGWDNVFGKQYLVNTVPTLFLLDKNGVVAATDVPGPKLDQEVKRLLGSTPTDLEARIALR